MPLLEVVNLSVNYYTDEGVVYAVDKVSLSIGRGEVVALVGESGSGKSTLAHAVMRLLPEYAEIASGRIMFDGVDLLSLTDEEMNKIRGRDISMIFQEPNIALNPVFTIGEFMKDVYLAHHPGAKPEEALKKAAELLRAVRIPSPEKTLKRYPHELSGGMKQRVLIATALLNEPSLLIADEPTSALDVSVQAQILTLLRRLQRERRMSILFITHNMAVAAQIADRIAVMYAGKVLEIAPTEDIFYKPLHPYTRMLIKAIPRLGDKRELTPLPGTIPDLRRRPQGCIFYDRCPSAKPVCKRSEPPATRLGNALVYCWLYSGKKSHRRE